MTETKFALQVSVEAHGETLNELALKRPTGEQIGRIGIPYLAVGEAVDFKMSVVMKYIGVLAGIPESSVRALDPVDLNGLAWMITGFFLAPATAPKI